MKNRKQKTTRAMQIMKQAKTCHPRQEQLLRGKLAAELKRRGLSQPLIDSALREFRRMIWRKSGAVAPE